MKLNVMLIALMLVSACAMNGSAIDQETVCAGWKPVLISHDDVLTEKTARGLLAHNEFGRENGCW